jgi:hypothetical protein
LKLFSFSAWKISPHALLAFNVSVEKSAVIFFDGFTFVCYLLPGTAQRAESPAELSSSSADLQGWDLAGRVFFIRLWHGEAFHYLSV